VSVAQVAVMTWHHPGNDVVVVQLSGGDPAAFGASDGGGVPSPPVLPVPSDPAVPPVTPDPPEQEPYTDGWHTKPLPQSVSALQGSCHLKAHLDVVVVVHVGGVTSAGASHFVFAGQAGAVPPEHAELVSWWQTMSVPQSLSAAQGPGWQVERVTATALPGPVTSVAVQSASGAHLAGVGVAMTADGWQV
jgi:hypothetical protein